MPALILDCEGVLADTELFGHLPAFNQTFTEFSVPVQWTESDYAVKLQISDEVERMLSVLTPDISHRIGLDEKSPHFTAARAAMIAQWYRRKSQIYAERITAGDVPARPGIVRLASEAAAAGWRLVVTSTRDTSTVEAVVRYALGAPLAARFMVVAGGDRTAARTPTPEIYRYALAALGADNGGLNPDSVVAVEATAHGVRATLGAGLRTLVTVSAYTATQDFAGASLVMSSLGEPDVHTTVTLADPFRLQPDGIVDVAVLEAILTRTPSAASPPYPVSDVEI